MGWRMVTGIVLLSLTAIFFALLALLWYLNFMVITAHMLFNGCPPPTDEEFRVLFYKAVDHLFKKD